MGTRTGRWLCLGLGAVFLGLGAQVVWPRTSGGAGSVSTVTYAWMQRHGPHGPRVTVDLYAPPQSSKRVMDDNYFCRSTTTTFAGRSPS